MVEYEYRLIWNVKDESTNWYEEERSFTTSRMDNLLDQLCLILSKPNQRHLKKVLRCNFNKLSIEEMKIELVNNVLTLRVVE